ncbi:putative gpi-anchored protein [Quercus suber]|uniref:Gpi-anchored protein n=1 Tax=Quercus suber TaxID=58331 RepID=A0AAW0KTB3_QUESU
MSKNSQRDGCEKPRSYRQEAPVLVLTNAIFTSTAQTYPWDDLNGYRRSLHLDNFTDNSNAACLANKIADQLKNETCKNAFNFSSTPGTKPNVPKFDKFLHKCDIKDKHAVDGIILPVCVPRLDPIVVFSNYT